MFSKQPITRSTTHAITSHLAQVINFDDVERLLGARPFASDQVRNIDRFRYGGEGKPPSQVEVCLFVCR
mgnify:CR=1 FL=1